MKIRRQVFVTLVALVPGWTACAADVSGTTGAGEAPCECEQTAKHDTPLHPLVGVVRAVRTDRQALLVRHEEIPGFMRAMTMLLRVEPDVLARVRPGDAIRAKLGRDAAGEWFLRDVEVTTPPPG